LRAVLVEVRQDGGANPVGETSSGRAVSIDLEVDGFRRCGERTVLRLEAIADGEGAGADLCDRKRDLNPITLAERSVIVCLGVHEREQDLSLADETLDREADPGHEGLVGIVRMTEEVAEKEPPGRVRVVKADTEGIGETVWIHV
jgi:hypothetical protein